VTYAHHIDGMGPGPVLDEFSATGKAGWKGENGFGAGLWPAETSGFSDRQLREQAAAGQLERRDIRLDGKPLAMLGNFSSSTVAFGFKTALMRNIRACSPVSLLAVDKSQISRSTRCKTGISTAAPRPRTIDDRQPVVPIARHIGRFSIELNRSFFPPRCLPRCPAAATS